MIAAHIILRKIINLPRPICQIIIIGAFPFKSLYGACAHSNAQFVQIIIEQLLTFLDKDVVIRRLYCYLGRDKTAKIFNHFMSTAVLNISAYFDENIKRTFKIAAKCGNTKLFSIYAPHTWSNQLLSRIFQKYAKIAIKNGHLEIVKLMMPNIQTPHNYELAVIYNQPHIAQFLQLYEDEFISSHLNNPNIAQRICEKKNFYNDEMQFSLKWATINGSLDALKHLISIYSTSFIATNIINQAAEEGHLEIVKFIMSDRPPYRSKKTAKLAAINGHIEIVKYLLDFDFKFHYNKNLIEKALDNGQFEVAAFLSPLGQVLAEVKGFFG